MSGTPTCPFETDAGVFGVKSDAEGGMYRPNPEGKRKRECMKGTGVSMLAHGCVCRTH